MAAANMKSIGSFIWKRRWILLFLLVVTPLGFLSKSYSGPGHKWFNNYGGGVLYEVFWCLVIFFFVPSRKNAFSIAVGVFLVTSVLEVLQLWQAGFLQQIRSTFLGGALLGNTFVWWDFPHYALGCFIGWCFMRVLSRESICGVGN